MTFCSRAGQRLDGRAHALACFELLVGGVGRIGLGGHQRGRQRALVEVLAGGERRGRFDRVDADDRAAQALLVGSDAGGQIGQRRLVSQLAAQRLARGVELAALAADAARPGVAAQRVDHRAADAPLGEGLELDAARPRRSGAPRRSDRGRRPAPDRRCRSSWASTPPCGGRAPRQTAGRRRSGGSGWRRRAGRASSCLLECRPGVGTRRCRALRNIATAVPTAASRFTRGSRSQL